MNIKRKRYDWDESSEVGRVAVESVKEFLKSEAACRHWYPVKLIESVEENKEFQKRDVDLLCVARLDGDLQTISIEVKGDRNDQTGNFFLETVSDIHNNIPGAFLVTRAKWYFYYFVNTKILFAIPVGKARKWFLNNIDRFAERETSSSRGNRSWRTAGRLVPIGHLMKGVEGCSVFRKNEVKWDTYKDV